MISIVMVFRIRGEQFNELWHITEQSINGILETADQPFELILIDNGSWSSQYIQSLNATHVVWDKMFPHIQGYRGLRFEEHVPLSKAWNTGVHQADGEHILIANNDIVYFKDDNLDPGWMTRMLEPYDWTAEERDERYLGNQVLLVPGANGGVDKKVIGIKDIGIVGIQHMSWGNFGGFVEGCLFMFPANFREEFALEVEEGSPPMLFDEQFTMSCEDIDLNRRVQLAGYATIQVNNPALQPRYMQHLGHRTVSTMAGTDEDYIQTSHENRVRLCNKWGFEPQIND